MISNIFLLAIVCILVLKTETIVTYSTFIPVEVIRPILRFALWSDESISFTKSDKISLADNL